MSSSGARPESTGHASLYYNAKEARKYDSSSRIVGVQREITERAIELLKLPPDRVCLVLDVGCGSGLSGTVLEEHGHVWMGCDVSRDMLTVARERMDEKRQAAAAAAAAAGGEDSDDDDDGDDDVDDDDDDDDNDDNDDAMEEDDDEDEDIDAETNDNSGLSTRTKKKKKQKTPFASTGDLMHHDMGTGLAFCAGTFDACISISAVQWLCYSNTAQQVPKKRLMRFFSSLYRVLKREGRAVLQFYPETAEHAVLISECAAQVGFSGGIVVDYPNSTKAKKHYLVLSFDKTAKVPRALFSATTKGVRVQDERAGVFKKKKRPPPKKAKGGIKTKEWIEHKKEVQRKKGKQVRPDSKYTGRRRRTKF